MTSTPLPLPKHPYLGIDTRDGKAVLFVPLVRNGGTVRIFEDNYRLLMDAGLSPRWFLNSNGRGKSYVRTWAGRGGGCITVARVLLGAGRGQSVSYKDGDQANLRRDNIFTDLGYARRARLSCSFPLSIHLRHPEGA